MKYDKNESIKESKDRHDIVSNKQARDLLSSQLFQKLNIHKYHSSGCDGNPSKAWCERCIAISIMSEALSETWTHGARWASLFFASRDTYFEWIEEFNPKHVFKK